jgi:hypothetical protein
LRLASFDPFFYITSTMNNTQTTAYVLRLPRKGNFAPIKVGCQEAKFIRTKMPNGLEDMWIANGKIYTDQTEFNELCVRVTPSAYKHKLQAFAYTFLIEAPVEKPLPLTDEERLSQAKALMTSKDEAEAIAKEFPEDEPETPISQGIRWAKGITDEDKAKANIEVDKIISEESEKEAPTHVEQPEEPLITEPEEGKETIGEAYQKETAVIHNALPKRTVTTEFEKDMIEKKLTADPATPNLLATPPMPSPPTIKKTAKKTAKKVVKRRGAKKKTTNNKK